MAQHRHWDEPGRLRSYDNYRFYPEQALSYGVEYRWNLIDERTPGIVRRVIRFDLSGGNEGTQSQLFITYPWSMFPVDSPN